MNAYKPLSCLASRATASAGRHLTRVGFWRCLPRCRDKGLWGRGEGALCLSSSSAPPCRTGTRPPPLFPSSPCPYTREKTYPCKDLRGRLVNFPSCIRTLAHYIGNASQLNSYSL